VTRRKPFLLLPLLVLAAGCVRFGWGGTWREQPLDRVVLAGLVPGTDDLESCLRKLGAPHYVWEYLGDGVALGWYFRDAYDLDFNVSYSFSDKTPGASFGLDWDQASLPGAVLWFDADLKLQRVREGDLSELTSGLRQRPSMVDDDTEGEGR